MSPGGTVVPLPRLARQVWRLLDAAQKRECVLILVISIAAGCFTLFGVAGIAPLLAVLADPTIVGRNTFLVWLGRALAFSSSDDFLVALGVGFVALLILSSVANLLATLAIARFSHRVSARFHVLLFEEYLHREFRFHASSNSDVLATHVVYDVNRTVGSLIQNGLIIIASAVGIALISAAVILVNPVVACGAAFAMASSYAVIYVLVRPRLIRDGAAIARLWGVRAKVIAESFESIKDIMIFRAQRERAAQVRRHSDAIARAQARSAMIAISPKYVLECVTMAGLVAAALWIHRSEGSGQWLTQIAFLGLASYRLLPQVQQIFAAAARVRSDSAGFERIADDLVRARQRKDPVVTASAIAEWQARPLREISLVGVSYRHSPERAGGISDISMQIPAGALIGLVGPNGSGKTTLANVLLGLLVPDAGQVKIDDVPLEDRNRLLWLTLVAQVPQNIVLLDASITQNVAFGALPEDIDLDRVRAAVRDAGLESVIDELPDGLSTVIGQNGSQLSGGERQRVGIARARYRRASLLVMDEATSSLDSSAEADVIELLRRLRGRCTTVLIAHRMTSLRGCDVVFELQGGRIVERREFADATRGSRSAAQPAKVRQ